MVDELGIQLRANLRVFVVERVLGDDVPYERSPGWDSTLGPGADEVKHNFDLFDVFLRIPLDVHEYSNKIEHSWEGALTIEDLMDVELLVAWLHELLRVFRALETIELGQVRGHMVLVEAVGVEPKFLFDKSVSEMSTFHVLIYE